MQPETFPQSKQIDFSSRKLFELAYGRTPPSTAEMVFSTLFGWEEYFGYRYSCFGDFLFVHYVSGGKTVVLPPLLLTGGLNPLRHGIPRLEPGEECKDAAGGRVIEEASGFSRRSVTDAAFGEKFARLAETVAAHARSAGREAVFCHFPEEYVRRLAQDRFEAAPERDYFEYVYSRADLADLPGRPYAPKRNLVRQFERAYPYRYEALGKDNLDAMRAFVQEHPHRVTPACTLSAGEGRMMERLLGEFPHLRLAGGMLRVNDRIVAAALGTIVPDFRYADGTFATAVVHYENALVDHKGAYQMINMLFCRHLPPEVARVNREEDLGIAGLRKAKLSYHPVRFIEKSRVTLRVGCCTGVKK